MSVFVVTIDNVLDEDTGTTDVVHIEVASEREGRDLIDVIVREEDADPADFSLVLAPDNWTCEDLCRPALLN